jgi:hypothetical protein
MLRKYACVASFVGLAALICGGVAVRAQTSLGTAQSFAGLGGSAVTNTGPSVLLGNLGVSPGSAVTGFPPGTVTGTIHLANAVAAQAQDDVTNQYNALAGAPCTAILTGQDLGGMLLTAGVYCFSSSAQLTGTLTLNAQGSANASFVFKTGSTLTTASGSSVVLMNGGNPCLVMWQIGSSATIGTGTSFMGNLIALSSITLTTGANLTGRALARNGALTLDTNNISPCSAGAVPTLATWAAIVLMALLTLAAVVTLRKRQSPALS